MNHPADIRYQRMVDQAANDELAAEQAAEEIADTLVDGRTVKVINCGQIQALDHCDLLEHLDAQILIAANKHAATGSHAKAVSLLSAALERAAEMVGKKYAKHRLAYLAKRNADDRYADGC